MAAGAQGLKPSQICGVCGTTGSRALIQHWSAALFDSIRTKCREKFALILCFTQPPSQGAEGFDHCDFRKGRSYTNCTRNRLFLMSSVDALTELFFRHDPVGLAEIGAPEDEYWPEAEALIGRLREATSPEHLRQIVHTVFLEAFEDEQTCGPESAYEKIAQEIWSKFLASQEIRQSWAI